MAKDIDMNTEGDKKDTGSLVYNVGCLSSNCQHMCFYFVFVYWLNFPGM
jgi:hypothetical protein